jgi:hypothetical protein
MVMPLKQSCSNYVGQRLLVLPYYGYGWSREDAHAPPPKPIDGLGPEPFHVQVEEYFSSGGQLVGAAGLIKEEGHALDRQWCVFCLRESGTYDFKEHPGNYMIWITQAKVRVEPNAERAVYEWVIIDRSLPCLCGYGTVAESKDWINEIYNRTMASRKLFMERSPGV